MRKIVLLVAFFLVTTLGFATTPAQDLIKKHSEIKGGRVLAASGSKMVFVRPALKRYTIGPMSDSVVEVMVLSMKKTPAQDREIFNEDMKKTLREYRYYGKSGSPDGLVDVYVHMKTEDCVDELVVFNPHTFTLNSLIGDFPVEKLLSLTPVTE
jgi:hypothetical protein